MLRASDDVYKSFHGFRRPRSICSVWTLRSSLLLNGKGFHGIKLSSLLTSASRNSIPCLSRYCTAIYFGKQRGSVGISPLPTRHQFAFHRQAAFFQLRSLHFNPHSLPCFSQPFHSFSQPPRSQALSANTNTSSSVPALQAQTPLWTSSPGPPTQLQQTTPLHPLATQTPSPISTPAATQMAMPATRP